MGSPECEKQYDPVVPTPSSKLLFSTTSKPFPDFVCMVLTPTSAGPMSTVRIACAETQRYPPASREAPKLEAGGTHTLQAPGTPARTTTVGLQTPPAGIQFFVFPKEIVVHLIVGGFEIVNIWLVRSWPWKLHMGSRSKRPDTESSFAERHKGRESQLD